MTTCERCGEVNPAEIHTCTHKPVAWHYAGSRIEPESVALDCDLSNTEKANCTPLYTAQSKREWHGLTEDDAISLLPVVDYEYEVDIEIILEFAKNIEAKLKQKNA